MPRITATLVGDSRKPRPGGRTERHTRAIYETTLSLLAAQGYAALTFNGVAAAAGVSRSTLYRRWSGRAELVLDAIGASLAEGIVPPDTGTLLGDLRSTLLQIGAYLSTPLGAAALTASIEMGTAPVDSSRSVRSQTRLADFDPMFDRAVARGEIAADFDREAGLALADGAVYFRKIFEGQANDEAWIERVVTLWGKLATRA